MPFLFLVRRSVFQRNGASFRFVQYSQIFGEIFVQFYHKIFFPKLLTNGVFCGILISRGEGTHPSRKEVDVNAS